MQSKEDGVTVLNSKMHSTSPKSFIGNQLLSQFLIDSSMGIFATNVFYSIRQISQVSYTSTKIESSLGRRIQKTRSVKLLGRAT